MVKLFGRRKQRHQAIEAFVCAEVSDWLSQVMVATEEAAPVLFAAEPPAERAERPSEVLAERAEPLAEIVAEIVRVENRVAEPAPTAPVVHGAPVVYGAPVAHGASAVAVA